MSIDKYRDILREAERDSEYWLAVPATEFASEVARRMTEQKVSRAELARRLGTTRANVTKLLRGDARLKLQTMARVAMALNATVHVHVADRYAVTRWIDVFSSGQSLIPSAKGSAPARTPAENQVAIYG
jgi:transcriptional regulator with XRE-family HTH domain